MTRQSEDVDAIKKLVKDCSTGWDNSNTEAPLSLYMDDPILMPQSLPAVIVKKTIRSLINTH